MAGSTRDMRCSVYERELKPKFGNQKLVEITLEDLRALTDVVVEREHRSPPFMRVRSCSKSFAGQLSADRRSRILRSWCDQRALPGSSRAIRFAVTVRLGYADEQKSVRAVYNRAEYR